MKYLLLLIPFLLVSCWQKYSDICTVDCVTIQEEQGYHKYIYDEYPEEDMIATLSGAIKYEILKKRFTREVFNPEIMDFEQEEYYAWVDAPYFKYRVTFDSGSVWYYYEQPYIQWGADLLLDEDNIKNK
mgnify:FL=1